MHLASRSLGGTNFWRLGPGHTQVKSIVPVLSICAVRTGCGKSPLSRLVAAQQKETKQARNVSVLWKRSRSVYVDPQIRNRWFAHGERWFENTAYRRQFRPA